MRAERESPRIRRSVPPSPAPAIALRDAAPALPARPGLGRRARLAVAGACGLLAVLAVLSMLVGAGYVSAGDVLRYVAGDAGLQADPKRHELLRLTVVDLRLPRTVAALVVGAGLGVAGALLQAVTRNPLADTGLLGVNAGAGLGVVVGITWFGASAGLGQTAWAFGGALCASVVVLLVTRAGGGLSPLSLVLAGAALSATLGGAMTLLLVSHQRTYDEYRRWILGSLSGVETSTVLQALPVVAVGLALAVAVARPLEALGIGEDGARALGRDPDAIRRVVVLAVALLSGAAIAVAGPITFLGLLAAFLARAVAGPRGRAGLLVAAVAGALVLLGADLLARVVVRPYEAPVGVLVALVGAPVLVAIARTKGLLTLGGPGARR
ncbi:iron ABC transporter permease [Patulibacter sp. SYSU D01012]|uniref:FecCD family ABC transporter permease n=1 Tax=Patulibacter sp. SYSU D01012 TaxID=2817381 RepID=UPI001B3003A9|nr:iron ABC transporter permease [Patulibacter sp. SYSU D01012]